MTSVLLQNLRAVVTCDDADRVLVLARTFLVELQ